MSAKRADRLTDPEAARAALSAETSLRKHEEFRSRFLPDKRNLIVYVPRAIPADTARRYPVLYLHDGQNLFDGTTAYIPGMHWHVGETAEALISAKAIQPVIIVGIYHAGERRVPEFTPTRDRRLGGGRAELYGRMLVEEVMPFIAARYPTLSGASQTAMGGSSLGGLVTLYLGLRYPDVFGMLAVLSPSVWWNNRAILRYVRSTAPEPRPKIWLDVGGKEGAQAVRDATLLRDALVEKGWVLGRDLHYTEVDGASHNEAAWAQRVGPFLEYLFPASEPAI